MTPSARRWVLVGLMLVSGCVNLKPVEDPTRFYVLGQATPGAPPETTPRPPAGLRVGIRQVAVADYLDTSQLVTRYGAYEVAFAEYHRWGEPLDRGVARALAGTLAADPGILAAEVVPWPTASRHDVLVQVRIDRFEGETVAPEPGRPAPALGYARVTATWELLDPTTLRTLRRGQFDAAQERWVIGDSEQLVTLLDLGLVGLGQELLTALRDIR